MKINAVLDIDLVDSVGSDESEEPVTSTEGKNWLKIDVADDDTIVEKLIKTARQQCEHYLNISLVPKTVTAILLNQLGDIRLPYGPIVELVSIKDLDDNVITDYKLIGDTFKWLCTPTLDSVKVVYETGYEDLPEHFKTAILEQIAYLYENRGDEKLMEQLSPVVKTALKPYRRVIA